MSVTGDESATSRTISERVPDAPDGGGPESGEHGEAQGDGAQRESAAPDPDESDALLPDGARAKMRTSGLAAYFGQRRVLGPIDLAIAETEITAIIGPTGCGKSTFVRCLNRMHEVREGASLEGEVWLDDMNIYSPSIDPAEVRTRVGMIFPEPNPFPTMSVADNVLAGMRLVGKRPSDPKGLVERVLRRVGLWDDVKDRLDESGASLQVGEQQRLCIARCLALEPDVILMDEPCARLDPVATARIEELIHGLSESHTIVLVTASLQQAARMSDRTAFLLDGELIEFGTTDDIFTNPRDEKTENYLTGRFG